MARMPRGQVGQGSRPGIAPIHACRERGQGRVCYLVGHLGRVAGRADAQIIPIYILNAASTAAAPPGTTWGGGPQPQSSWGCGPQPQNGSPHTTSRTRGTRKVDLMTDAA